MATYPELLTLFNNTDLKNRIVVACIVAADTIRKEDAGTANHANRLLWARDAFADPTHQATQMLMALLAANKDATTAVITGVTDVALQALVDAAVNVFAAG